LVSDIVAKANVAKGTFYYYFKSKEAILDAITDKYIILTVEGMEKIAYHEGLTALEKLIHIFLFSFSFRSDRKSIMQFLHEEKNAHLHLKFEKKIPVGTIGPLSRIIKQGINEGSFDTIYPEDAAKAFFGVSVMVLQGLDSADETSKDFHTKLMATFDFLERLLGAETGSLEDVFRIKGGMI
jgi:AcrR family transcriptional regulator